MISNVVNDILLTFRQSVGYCLIVAILALFVFLYAKEKGMKEICLNWLNAFKQNKDFRWLFVFVFYVCCIMFVTLFCRYRWTDPFQNVLGVWGLYDANGTFTTEFLYNIFLFVPFGVLLPKCFKKRIKRKYQKVLFIGFSLSLAIEIAQLIFCIGQFQLSDIFCNTVGTLIGLIIYLILHAMHHFFIHRQK